MTHSICLVPAAVEYDAFLEIEPRHIGLRIGALLDPLRVEGVVDIAVHLRRSIAYMSDSDP